MSITSTRPGLTRGHPAAPVRIVHLGLGAFSRSHTAWYTSRAADASDWGIAAYCGRSARLAEVLTAQDAVYTVIERSVDGDRSEIVESISRAHSGTDSQALFADLSAESTAIVTLTITEAGYRAHPDGRPDLGDPLVAADVATLSSLAAGAGSADVRLETQLARLVWGLELRRRGNGAPIAIVSCDNIPDNGGHVRRSVVSLARLTLPALADWCEHTVSFVSSSVDRITPRISSDEAVILSEQYGDRAPVLTEPFHDWVLSGDFPAGRPQWESVGARFTDDLEPWEARKLWLLNGAHTLLACLGSVRGHLDVAHAIADPVCRRAVEAFWDEAERHLPGEVDVPAYRIALVERFENPRIVHPLAQIILDTSTKLRLRVVPVAERERNAGRAADGCAAVFASWVVAAELGLLPMSKDVAALVGDGYESIRTRLSMLSEVLSCDAPFLQSIADAAEGLRRNPVNKSGMYVGNRLSKP